MAYTQAQWDRLQASLDPDARVSYLEYLQSADPAKYMALTKSSTLQQFRAKEAADAATVNKQSVSAVEGAAAVRAAQAAAKALADKQAAEAKAQATADEYYTKKVGTTGKTQAQLDALANAQATAALIGGTVDANGKVVPPKITPPPPPGTGGKTAAQLAAEAAAKAAAEAKAAADAKLAELTKKAEEAKAAQAASEKLLAEAKTAAELQAAKNAAMVADAKAALLAKQLEEQKKKAEEDALKAAADADAKLKQAIADAKTAADKAAAEATVKAAQEAKAAADAAVAAAAEAAAQAAAETAAANAAANINVTGNTVLTLGGKTAEDIAAKAEAEKAKLAMRDSTIKILTDRFNKYNLGSLATKIKDLAIDGANEATITLDLQETPEYKERFKANELRAKKGLAVLDPGTYLKDEDAYRQVLRAYGLKQFDTDDYVSQFIANDMSPTEFSNRIVTAVQRVQNADPAITKQLRDYYGIGQQDLVAYVLDPEQQFQKIERQVAAAEIGVAAARQGLTAGVSVAEQLAAQGVSEAEAQKGYATIADRLPTAEKLSQIYGNTMDTYGQAEAEQEVFNQLASAQRKRQKLTARELAAFSGASGTNRTSLTTSSVGQF